MRWQEQRENRLLKKLRYGTETAYYIGRGYSAVNRITTPTQQYRIDPRIGSGFDINCSISNVKSVLRP